MQLLCSTGAFTRSSDPQSHEAILRHGHEFAVDGLELIFYARWYEEPQRILRLLQASKLSFPVLHLEKASAIASAVVMPVSESWDFDALNRIVPSLGR